ncbi:MAG: hypothetical protein ACOH2N_15790 [Devosia sp.]
MTNSEEMLRFHVYGFEPNMQLVNQAFATPDDVGRILRVHLAIEQQMNSLIEHVSQEKVGRGTGFYQKLLALRCMKVDSWICDSIGKINDLRNALAHNPSATINNTKSIVQAIIIGACEHVPLEQYEIHLTENSKEAHSFNSLDDGRKVVIVAAMIAAYVGNMKSNRVFLPPQYKPVEEWMSL